jgi:hypothetical protein
MNVSTGSIPGVDPCDGTRPRPVIDGPELTVVKRTLAVGRLQEFRQFETLIARPR